MPSIPASAGAWGGGCCCDGGPLPPLPQAASTRHRAARDTPWISHALRVGLVLHGRFERLALIVVEDAARLHPRENASLADRRFVAADRVDVVHDVGIADLRIGEHDLE